MKLGANTSWGSRAVLLNPCADVQLSDSVGEGTECWGTFAWSTMGTQTHSISHSLSLGTK